ncbi:MAG: hypothetical protein IJB79_04405 [Candidatus Gastranaerophilales bacterium]|nr:hypothetical protein [Candidatus Gastranaerophilales bacterium]
MGISSVNIAYGASYGAYNQRLTQATRQKLEALGIPYNQNITEEEGKRLIKAFEAQKRENANQQGMFQNPSNSNDLFEKAKKLAEKLGIQVPKEVNFQQLLMAIQTKIEERLAISSNDINALKELKGLSQELAFIQAQSNGSSGYDSTNQALMTSLEMLGEYNKNFLNRN